jgi:cytochrome P450
VAFLRLAGFDVYFVNNADLVREMLTVQRAKFEISSIRTRLEMVLGKGLLTSRGELHARQRRLMQPVFRKSMIDSYAGFMAEYSRRQCETWRAGAELDITAELMTLTLKVAAKSLFDHEPADDSDLISRNLTILQEFYSGLVSPFRSLALKLPLPSSLRFRRALRELDELIHRLIEHRRQHPTGGGDLLSLLMQAKDDDTNVHMTERQIRDEVITLFGAGHETTANALGWTIYLLAQDPGAQDRLHAEVKSVLGERTQLDAGDAARLPYARQCLLEGLRLYPPAWFVGRNALEDVTLGPYAVPKGANVLMSQFLIHRDPRYFAEPLRFMPERWTAQFQESLPRGAFLPFSAGDRHCPGEGFAWLETLLVLGTFLAGWRFELVPGQDIRPKPSVTLRPNTGIRVRVHTR